MSHQKIIDYATGVMLFGTFFVSIYGIGLSCNRSNYWTGATPNSESITQNSAFNMAALGDTLWIGPRLSRMISNNPNWFFSFFGSFSDIFMMVVTSILCVEMSLHLPSNNAIADPQLVGVGTDLVWTWYGARSDLNRHLQNRKKEKVKGNLLVVIS